jgi:membrane-associated protease RseP (regulator of RpoE activity)
MAFSGEELGLLGSAHYVKNPVLPIQSTVAMLNMDMIGRMQGDRLIIGGLGTSPAWKPMLEELTPSLSIQMAPSDSAFGASDQQSFYLAKMPVLFFFTGLHADYHKPSDTAEKVNAAGTARIVQLVAGCAERIGNMPARPEFKELAPANSDSGQVRFRVSLGSIPDYAFDGEGVRLSGVRPGSPGDKAGLKEGDIIVKFGGRTIRSVQEYTVALGEHKPGDEVEIVVKRGAETVTVKAILAGTR